MEPISQQQIVTRLLGTAGALAVFVGCILVTQTIITVTATQFVTSNLPPGFNVQAKGAFGNLSAWVIVAQLATVVWGLVLFAVAKPIGARIVED